MRRFGFAWHLAALEDAYGGGTAGRGKLQAALQDLRTVSAREDFARQLRERLLAEAAAVLGPSSGRVSSGPVSSGPGNSSSGERPIKLLVGDTGTRLAITTLAETSRGRAATLPFAVGFEQRLLEGCVRLLRPMREFLAKEVGVYLHYSGLCPIALPTLTTAAASPRASIERITEGRCDGGWRVPGRGKAPR